MVKSIFLFAVATLIALPMARANGSFDTTSPYYFDGSISRSVLEHYLDRSVTAGYFLLKGPVENYEFPYREDDIRMVQNIGAKFIGRAVYVWGGESALADTAFTGHALRLAKRMHQFDPEMISVRVCQPRRKPSANSRLGLQGFRTETAETLLQQCCHGASFRS